MTEAILGKPVLLTLTRVHSALCSSVMKIHDELFCTYDLRSHLGSSSDLRFSMVEGQDGHYSTTVIRRAQKGRLSALRDDPNKVLTTMLTTAGTSLLLRSLAAHYMCLVPAMSVLLTSMWQMSHT